MFLNFYPFFSFLIYGVTWLMWESHSVCVWAIVVLTFGVILGIFEDLFD